MSTLLAPLQKALEQRPAIRTIDWARQWCFTNTGLPYSDFTYPHLAAPGGPFDAFDCPTITDIWLQWASRLGKTFGGQVCTMKQSECEPWPGMFASVDEKIALEVVSRTYGMLEHCEPLAPLLKPPHRRKEDKIDLRHCIVFVAWARSTSTLADKACRVGHANEIDKWIHQATSGEADPLKLFDERFKEFITYKRWKEGTPALRGSSRVERGRLGSSNASYQVECQLCGRYQPLRFGRGGETKGCIVWDKDPTGKSTKQLAAQTARYVCQHCGGELRDEHRGRMMRSGVWVPEGCAVDDEKARAAAACWREPGREPWRGWASSDWIVGEPARDGREWGSQLSSLCALSLTWGDIAAAFVGCKPQELRNFKNSWLAETWDPTPQEKTWEQVGRRVIGDVPVGTVPRWASLLTFGGDRQGEAEDRFPWTIDAWGPRQQNATIAYGQAKTFDELLEILLEAWPHEDGGPPLRVAFGLLDSGYRPKGVYEFCLRAQAQGIAIAPSKGSSGSLVGGDYERRVLGANTSLPGMELYFIDTVRTQTWIEDQISKKTKHDDDGYSLYAGSLEDHQEYLEQLLNDAAVYEVNRSNNASERWKRLDESRPNDYRDCRRSCYVGMQIVTGGGIILPRNHAPPRPQKPDEESRVRKINFRR